MFYITPLHSYLSHLLDNSYSKKIFFVIFKLFFLISFVFPKENLDSTIKTIGTDILKPVKDGSIICILDFSSPSEEMSSYIQEELTSKTTESGKAKIVTRAHMDKVNQELNFQLSGFVSDETALSICQRLGAQAIVFGQLKELDNKYNLLVKMIEVESAAYLLFRTYEFERSSKSEQLLGRAAIYNKAAIGVTAEANKNSLEKIAFSGGISFDYAILRKLSIGVRVNVGSDVFEKENSIFTIEPVGIIRFFAVSPSGEPVTGLFVEGQMGATVLSVNSRTQSCFNCGVSLGFRQSFSNLYIEPFVRGGYPYIFGAGINIGFRF